MTFTPSSDYLIGFDSDGTVFDTVPLEQKECYCPAVVKHFGCQPVSDAARDVWEYLTISSPSRGCSRFKAVQLFRDLLQEHPLVHSRGFTPLPLRGLDEWLKSTPFPSLQQLEDEVIESGNMDLHLMLTWSQEVDRRIKEMMTCRPCFPGVRQAVQTARHRADILVWSAAGLEDVEKDWEENGLASGITLLPYAPGSGRRSSSFRRLSYGKDRILLVGDTLEALTEAREQQALFFPILPGHESASWQELDREGLDRFFTGRFAGDYQDQLLHHFESSFPDRPDWRNTHVPLKPGAPMTTAPTPPVLTV